MTVIKFANTRNGFAIALLQKADAKGVPYYEVVRVDRSNQFVTIHRTANVEQARSLANREWRADRAA